MKRRYKEKEKERIEKVYREKYLPAYLAFIAVYPFGLEDLEGEVWKWVEGYEGYYKVSNYGRVKTFPHNPRKKVQILKPVLTSQGYLRISLRKKDNDKTIRINRLVALTFIPNPENKTEVNHIDGDKFNNCVENLEWCTDSENKRHAIKTGLQKTGAENPNAKLTKEQVIEIRQTYKKYSKEYGSGALAEKYGVDRSTILNIIYSKIYKS